MVTVKEVFDYAVETDMVPLAHRVYWAISKQHVQLHDDSHKLDALPYPEHEIQESAERNVLGIGRIRLYVIQTKQDGWYAFYLAENPLDAKHLHAELFREQNGKVTRADRLMHRLMTFGEDGREEILYDYRKRVVQYPNYLGHARAGERILHRSR